MKWSINDLMDMSLSKLGEAVMNREARWSAVRGARSWRGLRDRTEGLLVGLPGRVRASRLWRKGVFPRPGFHHLVPGGQASGWAGARCFSPSWEGTHLGKLNGPSLSSISLPGNEGVFFYPYCLGEANLFTKSRVLGQLTGQQYNQ